MATYQQINDFVMENHGYTVSTCWIAHIKERQGLPVRRSWNRQGNGRENPCPATKQESITEALRYFRMI